jgi:riboflavin kinase/FMN adenylyltransferase
MKVHRDIEHLPEFKNAVVTIGTFDGVHLGHQKIISQLKTEAQRVDGETVIITFHPHPRKIVANRSHHIQLLTTIDEKIELLAQKGVDHLVIVPFTLHFSEMEPKSYVEDFLKKTCRPAVVIIGYDHRFGRERKGDYKLLEEYSARGYFELKEISQQLINDSIVSSTAIRESLNSGDVEKANSLLGYDFFFEGTVVKGNQLGRTLGYPTANLEIREPDKIIPGDGIYAVEVIVGRRETGDGRRQSAIGQGQRAEERKLQAMMSIGVRPTIGESNRTIEVNIFDFAEDIYGANLRVYVKHYLRPEVKFNGLEELKAALDKDREDTLRLLNAKR